MKVIDVMQGSIPWLECRLGIPTASEFDQIISPGKWEIRTGEMPKTYLAKKLAEWWGGPMQGFSSRSTEQGQILESEARGEVAFDYDWNIQEVGFITTDDGRAGCSPDGLLSEACGLELKCPHIETHIKYLLAGKLPADYAAQVYGSMLVTGFPQWRFVSYRRGLPRLNLLIDADAEIQGKIGEAIALFTEKFEAGKKRLIELNDGVGPPPREKMVFSVDMQNEPAELPML